MTIRKGEAWGHPGDGYSDLACVADDAALAALADGARLAGDSVVATVMTGDLLRTLGVSEARPVSERYAYPIDLGLVTVERATGKTDSFPFVANVITGLPGPLGSPGLAKVLGHGPPISVAVMNAAWLGELRLGPKAHPNDGLLDVIEGSVEFRQRREARHRARSGSHLPHPGLSTTRTKTWTTRFEHRVRLMVDGVNRGLATSITVELVPDALIVVV